MSKIQSIQTNCQPQQMLAPEVAPQKAGTTSFKGWGAMENDVYSKTLDELSKQSGGFTKKLISLSKKLAANAGEVQNQVINAVFTTTLAPFFIAFNPLSDQDDKTKKYTALRQPVSAAIAISGGFAMTKVINNFMNKLNFEGWIPTTDGRLKPDAKFLSKDFKAMYEKAEDKVSFLEKYSPIIEEDAKLNKNGQPSKKYISAALDGYAEKVQGQRQKLFASLIGIDPKSEKFAEVKKAVIDANIPNLTNDEQISKYVENNSLYNATSEKVAKIAKELKSEMKELPKDSTKIQEVATNLIKSRAASVGKQFGALKGYTGIVTNLFTTAITCTALNWAYPRFVETFFPDLVTSGKKDNKAPKGGNE